MKRAGTRNMFLFLLGLNGPRGEFYFIIITKVFTRSVRVKYVACSPIKVVLNLTEFLSSTV